MAKSTTVTRVVKKKPSKGKAKKHPNKSQDIKKYRGQGR